MKKFALVLGVLALAVAASPPPASAFKSDYVRIKGIAPGEVLWLYEEPRHASKKLAWLGHLVSGIRVLRCQSVSDLTWCEVTYRGLRGWADERNLAPE